MKREFGIDLLKMLAMMMVVAHHVLMYGDFEAKLGGLGGRDHLVGIFHCLCYCAVNVFIMSTGWIMSRREFKYIRLFRLWRQFVGYSLFLTFLCWVLFPKGTVRWQDWIKSVMPVMSNVNWFLVEYVALFFTIPFLNKLLTALKYHEKVRLVVSGVLLLSVCPLVSGNDLFVTKWGYSFVWFLFLYILGATLVDVYANGRVYVITHSRIMQLVIFMLGGVLSETCVVLSHVLVRHFSVGGRFSVFAYSYASPTILLEALGLFLFFSSMQIKNKGLQYLISLIAPSTFIVFVVHTNDMFHKLTGWKTGFNWLLAYGSTGVLVGTITASVCVFGAIIIFDLIRRITVHRFLERVK